MISCGVRGSIFFLKPSSPYSDERLEQRRPFMTSRFLIGSCWKLKERLILLSSYERPLLLSSKGIMVPSPFAWSSLVRLTFRVSFSALPGRLTESIGSFFDNLKFSSQVLVAARFNESFSSARFPLVSSFLLKGTETRLLFMLPGPRILVANPDTGAGETSRLSIRVNMPCPGAAIITSDWSRPMTRSWLGLVLFEEIESLRTSGTGLFLKFLCPGSPLEVLRDPSAVGV